MWHIRREAAELSNVDLSLRLIIREGEAFAIT
jgi:hypothetical protein